MKGLDFFVNKGYSVSIECGVNGVYGMDIVLERNKNNRVVRGIEITREHDQFFVSCFVDWGGDGYGAQNLREDELMAVADFIVAYKANQKTIETIFAHLNEGEKIDICVSRTKIEITNYQTEIPCICSITSSMEMRSEGSAPEILSNMLPILANLFWN